MTPQEIATELRRCDHDVAHFVDAHCRIYDPAAGDWIPFMLWPDQRMVLDTLINNRLVCVLKSRQVGLSWISLAFILHRMLFRPQQNILLFSKRDTEAIDLLTVRLRGMYDRLPAYMRVESFPVDNMHTWTLSNGSRAMAFPANAGDSYQGTIALVDEADLVDSLDRLLAAVKPTVDHQAGRLILVSRADKSKPLSAFKRIFTSAREGKTGWVSVFLPWFSRVDRDGAWYQQQCQDVLARTGALDDVHEMYPATPEEALAPRSLDKRLLSDWLTRCYHPAPVVVSAKMPAIPGLRVYELPQPGRRYVIGADTSEGNPTSNPAALEVLAVDGGIEVASLAGRFEPSTLASYIDLIGTWFNQAGALVERNAHGHAVLLALREHSRLIRLCGHDGRPGWHTTSTGKALLFSHASEALREGNATIRCAEVYHQLASIEGSTLRAPSGLCDDRAIAFALALTICVRGPKAYPPPPTEDFWPCLLTSGYGMEGVSDEFAAGYESYRDRPPQDPDHWTNGLPPWW